MNKLKAETNAEFKPAAIELPRTKQILVLIAIYLTTASVNMLSTMISQSGVRAVAELGGTDYYALQFTLWTLLSTVTIPFFGKLGDMYGRKPFFIGGMALIALSHITIALTPSMGVFMFARCVMGVGCGSIFANYLSVLGEISNTKTRPVYMGIYAIVVGFTMIVGPLLSGGIIDMMGWRSVYWFLTILAVVTLAFFFPGMPSMKGAGAKTRLDWGGGITVTLFSLGLLLAFTWGGRQYEWASPQIIGLFAGAAVFLVAFIIIERKAENPILPLYLFKNRMFTACAIGMMFFGPTVYSFTSYSSMIGQGVLGMSATLSGSTLSVHAVGYLITGAITGAIISRTGKLKAVHMVMLLIVGGSMVMFSSLNANTSPAFVFTMQFISGFGMGPLIGTFTQLIQGSVENEHIGTATALLQFVMKIGGTIGITFGGFLFNRTWGRGLSSVVTPEVQTAIPADTLSAMSTSGFLNSADAIAELRSTVDAANTGVFDNMILQMKGLLSSSVAAIFTFCTICLAIAIILVATIRTKKQQPEQQGQ